VRELLEVKDEFRIIIDDPSGNSFLENPFAPAAGILLFLLPSSYTVIAHAESFHLD
jgi:hypothetical protein